MPVRLEDLDRSLAGGLAPVYLISGDETLLVEEACDAVLRAARSQGYGERSVLHAEGGFNWNDVRQDAASLSLFAERRLIDLRVPSGKFDRDASEVLRAYAQAPMPDTVLLIRTVRLEARVRSSAWFKALDRVGVVVLVWPVGPAELPRWLGARLRAANLRLTQDALAVLAERLEGNLLAAVQEIERLRLAGLPEPVSAEALLGELEDAAHYDAFALVDALLAGDAARITRMLRSLSEEGVSLFALLGAVTAQLRRAHAGDKLPPQRQRLLSGFLRRIERRGLGMDAILAQAALIDAEGKGQLRGDAWLSFEDLLLRLCDVDPFAAVTVPAHGTAMARTA
ncbi:MAG: DNA polymerase III subunit delta [Pseudomonadales bacterium]